MSEDPTEDAENYLMWKNVMEGMSDRELWETLKLSVPQMIEEGTATESEGAALVELAYRRMTGKLDRQDDDDEDAWTDTPHDVYGQPIPPTTEGG